MFHPKLRKGVLKRGLPNPGSGSRKGEAQPPVMTSSSGTVLQGGKKAVPARSRPSVSEPRLSRPVNATGKFNSELKRTGFLGEAKMRARRIADNPRRFLEAYAEAPEALEIVPTEVPELESFIQNLTLNDRYEKKEAELVAKAKAAKNRAFMLSMASVSSIDLDSTEEFLSSYSNVRESGDGYGDEDEGQDGDGSYADSEGSSDIVIKYLEELKSLDTEAIEEWLTKFYDLKDLVLPYGLPTTLKIPRDPLACGTDDSTTLEFIESAQDNFLLLDGEYHNKLEEITREMRKNYDCIHGSGWDLKSTCTLYYVLNILDTSSSNFTPLQLELTTRLFPATSRKELIAQKYRLRTKKALEEKRTSVIRTWVQDKEELEAKVNRAWQEVSKKRVAELEKRISLRKQADLCLFWSEQLEKMRKDKCYRIKKVQVLIEPAERLREGAARSAAEREEFRRKESRAKLNKYKKEQWEEKISAYEEKQLMADMMQDLVRVNSVANQSRIAFRKQQWDEKEKARHELEASLDQERMRRAAILESSKEPVEIDYDPASVVLDTHASMVRRFDTLKQHKDPEDEGMAKLFRDCYSFSTESILKDRRVRLESKLREAGLLETSYARQVLLAMQPKVKPHLKSQIKFDD